MKCLICNVEVVNGQCPSCKTGGRPAGKVNVTQGCQVCGGKGGRARHIKASTSVHSDGWYCYDCYQEMRRKRYHETSKSFKTKAEASYYRALEDHCLKPLFYGEEPNYDPIEQKRADMIYTIKKDDIV